MRFLPPSTAALALRPPRPLFAAIVAALLAAAAALGGCNIVGPIFFVVHGPEKARKLHALDRDRPAVIFVDDRHSQIPRRALRIALGEEAERELLAKRTVRDMISTQSALQAAGSGRSGQPVPIVDIGRAVEAEVVIYVTVDDFRLTTDGQTYAPQARLRVKVVDVVAERQVWPQDERGHPVTVRPPARAGDLPASLAARFQAEDELARAAGLQVARLFFDHERPRGATVPK